MLDICISDLIEKLNDWHQLIVSRFIPPHQLNQIYKLQIAERENPLTNNFVMPLMPVYCSEWDKWITFNSFEISNHKSSYFQWYQVFYKRRKNWTSIFSIKKDMKQQYFLQASNILSFFLCYNKIRRNVKISNNHHLVKYTGHSRLEKKNIFWISPRW